jgi:hypothetical protein
MNPDKDFLPQLDWFFKSGLTLKKNIEIMLCGVRDNQNLRVNLY